MGVELDRVTMRQMAIRVGQKLDRAQGIDELEVYRRWEKVLARRAAAIEREHDRSAAFAEAAPARAGDHRLI